jgi:hypothetical protein
MKRTQFIERIRYFLRSPAAALLVILLAGCSSPNDDGKVTSAEKLWYKVNWDYRTNDLRTAYELSVRARNQLEILSRTKPTELHYSYCLAILNGRLFLMARSLGDTNAADQFLLESRFYFNEGLKEGGLPVTNFSPETIEHYIKVYDMRVHPDQTNDVP